MKKWKHLLRMEMDVEVMCCVHAVSMIFMYGLIRWFIREETLEFSVVFEMMLLGYAVSWIQKLLFFHEKAYTGREYKVRGILWCLLPVMLMVLCGRLFEWFSSKLEIAEIIFYMVMLCYYVMLWLFMEFFYRKDSREMNQLLKSYKKKKL